jgi:DNA-binding MarR family transcriptional regulator
VNLVLTRKGTAVLSRAVRERCQRMASLLGHLSRAEQLTLITLIGKMVNQ